MSSSSDDSNDENDSNNSSSSSSDSSDNEEVSSEEEEKKSPTPKPTKKRARSRSRDHSREKKRERRDRRKDRRRDDERPKYRRRSRDRERGRGRYDRRVSDDELEGQCPSPPPPACLRNKRRPTKRRRSRSPRTERQKQERRLMTHYPEITRIARRLYVGNLNASFEYTKENLKTYFSKLSKERGIKTRDPVKSIWIAVEKTFCFVEFRSVRDAERGMEAFKDAHAPCGRPIRVGRPKNYEPPPKFLKNYIVGETPPRIPRDFDIKQIDFYSLEHFGNQDYNSSFSLFGGKRGKGDEREIPMLPLPGKGSFQMQKDYPDATRVVMLESRVFQKELTNPSGQKQLLAEIRAECKTFGKVLQVKCVEKTGRVFVKYNTIDSSVKCKQGLDKKLFNHSKMTVSFYREDKF